MSDEQVGAGLGDQSPRRRRRRRRRRRGGSEGPGADPQQTNGQQKAQGAQQQNQGRRAWRTRDDQPAVNLPSTGRLPRRRRAIQTARGKALSGPGRRRRLTRMEMEELQEYLARAPEEYVNKLYAGLGGQPDRVPNAERTIQLTVRALAQGTRIAGLVKSMHQRDRQALAVLVHAGGIAHCEELIQELVLSLGGPDREWKRVLTSLGDVGLVAATEERDGQFFYVIPDPLVDQLIEQLGSELELPSFEHPDVRVLDEHPFCPPITFSVTTLATYIDQHPPRLTQRHEIFRTHKLEMDAFFGQLWGPDSELFSFHIEFLMLNAIVELKGDRLSVNRSVLEEWLQLDPEDQRDLVFASLDTRFPLAEWVLWAVHDVGGDWVPERPLQALYRRWKRGEDWRDRLHKGQWSSPRTAERESFTFTSLVNAGMLELGQWGQEKFYRLTPRAKALLEPQEDEGFSQFYLTPSFEIMAPAGMAPILLFRIGEIAELTACDRANTYKITQVTVEQALERGWRRDDVLEFLRENSQIGLPDNVEQTLRGWMGTHGDVEFHDVMLLTVHKSQIKKLEGHRQLKPYLVHRFVPGMYAIDRTRLEEIHAALRESGFVPVPTPRKYPDDPQAVDARHKLLRTVAEARDDRDDPVAQAHRADTQPELLHVIPDAAGAQKKAKRKRDNLPPRRSPREIREIVERAVALGHELDMLFVTKDGQRKVLKVKPERLAVNQAGDQVLVATDTAKGERLSYKLVQIERMGTREG